MTTNSILTIVGCVFGFGTNSYMIYFSAVSLAIYKVLILSYDISGVYDEYEENPYESIVAFAKAGKAMSIICIILEVATYVSIIGSEIVEIV